MSKMWKPGSSKPKADDSNGRKKSPKNQQAANSPTAAHTADSGSGTKKKLSGTTMGMRFMQRKMEAEKARQQTLERKQKDEQKQDQMEWTATTENDRGSNEEEPSLIPLTATASDMYGEKSGLIGRRSFGGFRPQVSDTYKSACTAYERGQKNEDSKRHISDEELLRRYRDHVTGKADMTDFREAVPIGNLKEKLQKRGKRKNQSPQKSEKRKR